MKNNMTFIYQDREITVPKHILEIIHKGYHERYTERIDYLVDIILEYNYDDILSNMDFIKWRTADDLCDDIIANIVTFILVDLFEQNNHLKKGQ